MYGVMMADFYLVKKHMVKVVELYTMRPDGRYYYDGGWNKIGLAALAISGVVSIGWELSTQLFKLLPENNFGWIIGASAGAVIYYALMRQANRK
jgi:NCS1 family nucleobase:cation symporter-1